MRDVKGYLHDPLHLQWKTDVRHQCNLRSSASVPASSAVAMAMPLYTLVLLFQVYCQSLPSGYSNTIHKHLTVPHSILTQTHMHQVIDGETWTIGPMLATKAR